MPAFPPKERLSARILIAITGTQLAAVYDYQRDSGIDSTSQALRNLIALGLLGTPEEYRRVSELWPVIKEDLKI